MQAPDPASTAWYFGTFNPVHTAHLLIAQAVLNETGLSRVVFVPAAHPPHRKQDPALATAGDRLTMLRLATEAHPQFSVNPLELARPGPSYTVETLQALYPDFPATRIYLVIGTDALAQLATWQQTEALIAGCHFLQAQRNHQPAVREISLAGKPAALQTTVLGLPQLELSASWVRKQHAAGRCIRYAVPEPVRRYILANGLYRHDAPPPPNDL